MKVKNVKSGLEKLLPVLEAWEAGKIAKDFQKLIELMDGHEDLTIDAFCKKASQGLAGKAARPKSGANLRQEVVNEYISQLKNSEADEARFHQTVQTIAQDKQVRLKELKAISTSYLGFAPLSQKKSDLLDEIKAKRAQELRTEQKFKILSQW